MSDSELFYQILFREIDNIAIRINNPMLGIFLEPGKKYIKEFLDPYVNAFMNPNNKIDTDMAGEFLKSEINTKIEDFKKAFNEKKDNK